MIYCMGTEIMPTYTDEEMQAAIKDEWRLKRELKEAQDREQQNRTTMARYVTVVTMIEAAIDEAAKAKDAMDKARKEPKRWGMSKAAASRAYFAKGRELRNLRKELKAITQSAEQARKSYIAWQGEQRRIERAILANKRLQASMGLLPVQPKRTTEALEALASMSGLLDGGF